MWVDNYQQKFDYLCFRQDFLCAISNGLLYPSNTDLHHLMHNNKWRRNKFPLFLNSVLNLRAVDHDEHLKHPSSLKIHDLQAEKYERFLERHPMISEWVNNPI